MERIISFLNAAPCATEDRKDSHSLFVESASPEKSVWAKVHAFNYLSDSYCRFDWSSTHLTDITLDGTIDEGELYSKGRSEVLLVSGIEEVCCDDLSQEVASRLIKHRYDHMLPTIFFSAIPMGCFTKIMGDQIMSRLGQICEIDKLSSDTSPSRLGLIVPLIGLPGSVTGVKDGNIINHSGVVTQTAGSFAIECDSGITLFDHEDPYIVFHQAVPG